MNSKVLLGAVVVVLVTVGFAQGGFNGNLDQRFFTEGVCPGGRPTGTFFKDLNITWIVNVRDWYINWGSRVFFLQDAEVSKGGPIKNFEELEGLCLKTEFDLNSTTTGYGRSFSQLCSFQPEANPYVKCSITRADPGTDTRQFAQVSKRVILSDNKSFAVFVRCANGLHSYYIASTTPKLSYINLIRSVLELMKTGFDPRNLVYLDPKYCSPVPYYNPLQSYLYSASRRSSYPYGG